MQAIQEGHLATVQLLIAKGSNINAQDEEHFTPLMCAAKFGWLEIVKILINQGSES